MTAFIFLVSTLAGSTSLACAALAVRRRQRSYPAKRLATLVMDDGTSLPVILAEEEYARLMEAHRRCPRG